MPVISVNMAPRRLCPEFGSANLATGLATAMTACDLLGAGGMRVDLHWDWLEPTPGRPNAAAWAWYGELVAAARTRGVALYALLYHPPAWAIALAKTDPTAFLAAWRRFCDHVGKTIGQDLAIVQVWNEPNNRWAALKGDAVVDHWPGVDLADMFLMARAAFPPHVKICCNVLVGAGASGLALPTWSRFLDRLFARVGPAIDTIAIDHYPDTWATGGTKAWECVAEARRRAATKGDAFEGKQVIVGELGFASGPTGPDRGKPWNPARHYVGDRNEAAMASWYARTLADPVLADLDWINVYELFDAPVPTRPGAGLPRWAHPVLAMEDHFGLIRRDGTPKPAFAVVQAHARAGRERGVLQSLARS